MMLPTHALGGLTLGLAAAAVVPEFAGVALAAGLLGGVFPDLDLYTGHRKTLHYPVYYSALAAGALALAVLIPGSLTVGAALVLFGAATHSVADIFGGGLELRPWEATSDRAVYDHYRRQWVTPRRWVGYDGSPGDLLLSVTLAVPLLFVLEGVLQGVVLASLIVGTLYTVVRRILPDIADVVIDGFLVQVLPGYLLVHVPDRYL
ncbi:MAG: metal-dependent hydrolase [Halovenus sp.]